MRHEVLLDEQAQGESYFYLIKNDNDSILLVYLYVVFMSRVLFIYWKRELRGCHGGSSFLLCQRISQKKTGIS